MSLISIITPCYNEELCIVECYDRVKTILNTQLSEYQYEHIFCDNASTDSTVELLKKIASKDKNVKIIINSRNFGPMRSNFNGVLAASGDAVIVFMPADLQDPPELIPTFIQKWKEGYKVVYGVRAERDEFFVMRAIRKMYYRLVAILSGVAIPVDAGDYQLIDKQVLNELKKHDDYYPYMRGMIANCGFKSIGIPYRWTVRHAGMTKNRMYHLVDQGLNGIISFSNVPLRICMIMGFIIAVASLGYSFVQLLLGIIYYQKLATPGITTLIVALFFFSGVLLFFIGLLGEYIGAIHQQVRKRPMVIEEDRINF